MSDVVDVGAIAACGVDPDEAARLAAKVEAAISGGDPLGAWRSVAAELRPDQPFELHRMLHAAVFDGWDEALRGPAPVWIPGEIGETNLARLMRELGVPDYPAVHRLSVDDPERFWATMMRLLGVRPEVAPERALDSSNGAERARWMPGMRLSIARSALERDGDRVAVVFQREGGAIERRSLRQLAADSARVAAGLAALGVGQGDAVAIDMPMTYESVAIYLGVVRLGAAVVAIADSFAPAEIATRVRIGRAVLVFTQDVILRGGKEIPLYQRVIDAAAPRAVVLPADGELRLALREGDIAWDDFVRGGDGAEAGFTVCDAEAVTNVLFSSGTTGEPKAIPWTHITPIKAAADAFAHHDIRPGDVVCWPTNLGWMMGPWLIYAAFLNDAAIALYQGSPLGRDFGRFVQDARVTMLGVVPSLVRAWIGSSCMAGLDWSAIRCFSSTGEASTPHEMHWLCARAGYKPVIEYCGGTEIGGGYITGTVVQPQVASAFSTAALGCDVVILDDEGRPADEGEAALVAPMLGSSNRLLNRDHHEVYFAGMPRGPRGEVLRRHGDQMRRLPGGYYRALGRVDDTMNLGGIKTSSAEIERVCNRLAGVHECAAIAASPREGGPSRLVLYVVPEPGAELDPAALKPDLQNAIARELNPLFRLHDVVVAPSLPRTASNKVMRRVLRAEYEAAKP